MLDFDSEDIDGMDDDAGGEQEPLPTGHWTSTSSYDIYMVDTPKEGNSDEITEDDPSKKQPKRRRQRRRPKSRQSKSGDIGTGDNNTPDSAEDNNNPLQQDLEQEDEGASSPERAADGEEEDDNYMPPSEDEASLGDGEFAVPEDPVEQERFKRRLIATANSLKKKQQQLQADQDLLADKWTEVLRPRNINSSVPPRVTQSAGYYPDWRKKRMIRLIGHLVAAIERHSSQKLSLHPDAIQIKRHGEILQTCETY